MHPYFWTYGFNITGQRQVNYAEGEIIEFNLDSAQVAIKLGLSSIDNLVWAFYNSRTGALIKSVPTFDYTLRTSFTLAEGKDGIDVSLTINWGIYQTFLTRKRRVVIHKALSADYTINLSQGVADSRITLAAADEYDISLAGIAGGSTVRLVGTIAAKRINIVGAGNNTNNPITLYADSNVVINKLDIISLTGTSGTANLRIKLGSVAQNYLATFNSSLSQTAIDFVNTHAATILAVHGMTVTASGTTLRLIGDAETVANVSGTLAGSVSGYDEVVRITVAVSTPANGLHLIGKVDALNNFYWKVNFGGFICITEGNTNINGANNVRFSGMDILRPQSSGIKPKLEYTTRAVGAMDDCWVYGNKVTKADKESYYIGYNEYTYTTDPVPFVGYHHAMKRVKLFANESTLSQWDAGQISCGDEDSEIHDNYFWDSAQEGTSGQNFSIVMNTGYKGQCYNNVVNNKIQCLAYSDTYIYNNIIYAATSTNGIFIKTTDNPMQGSPAYQHTDPALKIRIFNNFILSDKDSIYILEDDPGGTAKIPIANLYIANNSYVMLTDPVEGFVRYAEPVGTTILITNNVQQTLAGFKIKDPAGLDFSINGQSPVFYEANEGVDVSVTISESELKVGFTDITGLKIPVRGYWKAWPIQREDAFKYPSKTNTQISWYKTNQSVLFLDREKVADMFGSKVKTYTAITSGAKPKLLAAVKPIAKTGTKNGLETIDTVSQ